MRRISRFPSGPAALAAAGVGGAALLLLTRPTRGQQPMPGLPTPVTDPAIQESVPAAATGPATRVDYQFALPPGTRLLIWPRVEIFDDAGQLRSVVPTVLDQQVPAVTGFARLHTKRFPAGTFHVAIAVDLALPDGTIRSLLSPKATLTVAEGVPEPTR